MDRALARRQFERHVRRIVADVPVPGEFLDTVSFFRNRAVLCFRKERGWQGADHLLDIPVKSGRYSILCALVKAGYGKLRYTKPGQVMKLHGRVRAHHWRALMGNLQ